MDLSQRYEVKQLAKDYLVNGYLKPDKRNIGMFIVIGSALYLLAVAAFGAGYYIADNLGAHDAQIVSAIAQACS